MGSLDPYSDPDLQSGSGSRRAKKTHKHRKKLINSFFEVLDILFWGLKASPVAWTWVNLYFFSSVFVHQKPGSGLDPEFTWNSGSGSVSKTPKMISLRGTRCVSRFKKGIFKKVFQFNTASSAAPQPRIHCDGGCWDWISRLLQRLHWQQDALRFWLDLIHTRLDLILTRLDLIHTRLDLINTRLDLIRGYQLLEGWGIWTRVKSG